MASLTANGTKVEARWEGRGAMDSNEVRRELALRSDGVLLQKTTWLDRGKVNHTTGWKVKARHTRKGGRITTELIDKLFATYRRVAV